MAVVDATNKTVTVKLVFYGCALGGKTTNLVTLHRLTDPDGRQGLVSIATTNDRTLFFDLLPMDLGQIGGLTVKVKLYTVPGQLHYELTRRQVLGGADAVVLVVDSSVQAASSNVWAYKNLRENLVNNGLDPETIPTVLQWNKRDLPDARPVSELDNELNSANHSSFEAVATTGVGVVETFAETLKQAVTSTYAKAGKKLKDAAQIGRVIDEALEQARSRVAADDSALAPTFHSQFDWEGYHQDQEDLGHDRHVVDQASLLSESVNTSMMLAEKLDALKTVERLGERRGQMMDALSHLAPMLADPAEQALPKGVMSQLLEGCQRERGSLMLFQPNEKTMEEWEVLPDGKDWLNATMTDGLGSVAHLLCERDELSVIEDIATDVFFGQPPDNLAEIGSLLVVPVGCDGMAFGGLLVYSRVSEQSFDETECKYWATASVLVGLSLHWHALRRKVSQAMAS